MNPIKVAASILVCIWCFGAATGCSRSPQQVSGKLQVVTSLFPVYDFARTIAGDYAEVSLLLPPGVEPHNFEPKPDDVVRIGRARLFVYTNRYMEPWATAVIKGVGSPSLQVVDAGQDIDYRGVADDDDHGEAAHGHEQGHAGRDPHIWLDFDNASRMVDSILAGFLSVDPSHGDGYRRNAVNLKSQLNRLDQRYRDGLAHCNSRVLVHGGHYAFGYLARRYGLQYHALSGVSSESEPTAARMAAMVRQIKQAGVHYLFAEELLSPRLTETVAAETGAVVLHLHAAHNLGQDDFKRGVTFISLMEENLGQLQKGLACRTN